MSAGIFFAFLPLFPILAVGMADKIPNGCGPEIMAALRNAAIGFRVIILNLLLRSLKGVIIMVRNRWWQMIGAGAAAWMLGSVFAQEPGPVRVVGAGEIAGYYPLRGYEHHLELRVRNVGRVPATISRAEVLLMCQGGWSVSQGESISRDGKFMGGDAVLKAGSNDFHDWRGIEPSPYTYWFLTIQVGDTGRVLSQESFAIPYQRRGYASPPPLKISAPVFIGLQSPLEAVELTGRDVWLGVVGQIINLTARPLGLRHWRFQVKDPRGKVMLDRDLLSSLTIAKSTQTLNEFYHGLDLPRDFQRGALTIEGEVELDGRHRSLTHSAPVERTEGYLVKAPLSGVWSWQGGPGAAWFSGHLHDIASRCSYDILMFKNVNGIRINYSGDREKNENCFGWDQPIHCVEAGKVVVSVDTGPDNQGPKMNPANASLPQNCIWVEHANSRLSCYYHIRQGSATVKTGQHVRAGQVIARTGNSGNSPETHLHFGYLALDRHTGHYRNVPVRIDGLKFADGRPAPGVPRDETYLSTPAE
jgi:Peptidase family M23